MARPFHVDPSIERARTIDPRAFFDPGLHARLVESVFARTWQLIRTPGSGARAEAFTLLPGELDEPLLLARAGGVERVLSNVCTHRGHLVCEGECDGPELVCGYHGRRFSLDGRMRAMPSFEGAADFPTERDDLAELELARLGPLRFTRLAKGIAFDVWSAPLAALLLEYEGEPLVHEPRDTRDFEVAASWALYVENYLEGFHVPFVHEGLHKVLDPATYRTELLPHGVRQVGLSRAGSGEPCMRRASEPRVAGDYLWLWPNLMVNAYPWGISVNLVEPVGPTACRVRYLSFVARPELRGAGAGADLERVELEDEEVVERVQRGVRSRFYGGGRFSPQKETGPHWFERMLARELAALEDAAHAREVAARVTEP